MLRTLDLPWLFHPADSVAQDKVILHQDNSQYVSKVLRLKQGEHIILCNGQGMLTQGKIEELNPKATQLSVVTMEVLPPSPSRITLCISPLKNTSRFEWIIEKSSELGVSRIVPLTCQRTEKIAFKSNRLQNIIVSASLQSRKPFFPVLDEAIPLKHYVEKLDFSQQLLMAHCNADFVKKDLIDLPHHTETILFIGPEGDFSKQELEYALSKNIQGVSLGKERLRSETAALFALSLLQGKRGILF